MTETGDETEKSELVVLGRIMRARGLRGEVRVQPFGMDIDLAAQLQGKSVLLRPPDPHGAVRRAHVADQFWQRDAWVVAFEDCTTREAAEGLAGWDVCLHESDLPQLGPGTYYHDELVGLRVEDARTGETLGQVIAVRPAAAADLLQVRRPGGGLFLIPLVRAMVTEVNLFSSTITVDLPEGLIDVNA